MGLIVFWAFQYNAGDNSQAFFEEIISFIKSFSQQLTYRDAAGWWLTMFMFAAQSGPGYS